MALSIAELAAITQEYYRGMAEDIYFQGNALFYKLQKSVKKISGGTEIRVPLMYKNLNAGSYKAGDTFDTTKVQIHTAAQFNWRHYYVNVTIDVDDETQNDGDLAVVNLVESKLKAADLSIQDDMGTDLYALQTGSNLDGLGGLFLSTTTTAYGGIQEGDTSWWGAKVTAATITLSLSVLRGIRQMAHRGVEPKRKYPDLYVTTEALLDYYKSLLQANQRFTDPDMANAGFVNVEFEGASVTSDDKVTAGYVYALNTQHLGFYVKNDRFFTKTPWKEPTNQDVKVMQILWSGNLVCTHRSAHVLATVVSAA